MVEKHIKNNGSMERVPHCDPRKRGKVVIHEGVYEVCDDAFVDCKHVTEVRFPESLAYIGRGAFNGCDSLKRISIPKNVKRIGNDDFTDVSSLKTIVCHPVLPPEIPDFPHYYKSPTIMKLIGGPIYAKVNLYVPSESIEAYSNHNYWGKFEIESIGGEEVE